MKDPILHMGIADCLPDNHPLAWEGVICEKCEAVVHAMPNETMQPWVESGSGNFCFDCFYEAHENDKLDIFRWALEE